MKYNKPALIVKSQLELLKSRNLIFDNEKEAENVLSNISYYHLSSYLYPFRIPGDKNQSFYPNTNFSNILKIYSFDRKLRLLLFDAIERIEIAFKTQFILQMSLKYDPFWYINPDLFYDIDHFNNIIESFKREYNISNEVFIEHFKQKYSEPEYPPAWMSIEIFTFGQVSRHFSNMKKFADKKKIAEHFGIESRVLESWLHSISYLRNICAHHARLWNRTLRVKPQFPNSKNYNSKFFLNYGNDKIFSLIIIMKYLLDIVHSKNSFKEKIQNLLMEYPSINKNKMGFPQDWDNNDIWKGEVAG
jgi:abortive infection bacteriophage resistance protein